MPTNKEKILEHYKLDVINRIFNIDPNIEAALRSLLAKLTPLHTFSSVSHSLSQLIKSELDPAYEKWLQENGFFVHASLSDLIHRSMGSAIKTLEEVAEWGRGEIFSRDELSRTCDTLINFVFFCGPLQSTYERRVTFQPKRRCGSQDLEEERFTIGKKHFTKLFLKEFPYGSPQHNFYSDLLSYNICLACGSPTGASIERKKRIRSAAHSSIRASLEAGKSYYSKDRGSHVYCEDHSEKLNGSTAGKKARRWRGMFISFLLAMRYKKIRTLMNELIPPSDELEFAKKAIKNRYCYKHLTLIKKKMLQLTGNNINKSETLEQEIFECIRHIFLNILKLTPKPFNIREEDHLILYQDDFSTVLDGRKLGFTPLRVAVSKIDV